MKKIIVLTIIMIINLFILNICNSYAIVDDYLTFSEIMMNTGKLLSNFTEKDYQEYLTLIKPTDPFFSVEFIVINDNVDATYISNTLYSFYNNGDTDITYSIKVDVCTSNKRSFKLSESLGASLANKIKDFKADFGYDMKTESQNVDENSAKETKDMDIIVESNSKCILFLTGNLSVTNGVIAIYILGAVQTYGGFEQVTIKNQYTRIEKVKI